MVGGFEDRGLEGENLNQTPDNPPKINSSVGPPSSGAVGSFQKGKERLW